MSMIKAVINFMLIVKLLAILYNQYEYIMNMKGGG